MIHEAKKWATVLKGGPWGSFWACDHTEEMHAEGTVFQEIALTVTRMYFSEHLEMNISKWSLNGPCSHAHHSHPFTIHLVTHQ